MTSEPSRRRRLASRLAVPGRLDPATSTATAAATRPSGSTTPAGTWRGIRTPEGPATLVVEARPAAGEVARRGLGSGRRLGAGAAPDLLGGQRRLGRLRAAAIPCSPRSWRRHPHARLGRSGLVMEALVPAIIEQKVTGQEAFAGFRMLVHRFGERAPGPGREQRLWVQPSPDVLRAIPSWEWLRLHIDPARSRAVVTVARVADSLERTDHRDARGSRRRLRSLPGIGGWTSAEVRQRSLRRSRRRLVRRLPRRQGRGLGADRRRVRRRPARGEFLEPWRPQRGGSRRWSAMAGLRRPRRGPRMSPRESPTCEK